MKLKLAAYCLFTAVIAFLVSTCSTSSKAIVSSTTNVVVEKEVIKSPEIVVKETIASLGAEGMKDMGRVMGVVSGKLAGKADGKTISVLVRNNLS